MYGPSRFFTYRTMVLDAATLNANGEPMVVANHLTESDARWDALTRPLGIER